MSNFEGAHNDSKAARYQENQFVLKKNPLQESGLRSISQPRGISELYQSKRNRAQVRSRDKVHSIYGLKSQNASVLERKINDDRYELLSHKIIDDNHIGPARGSASINIIDQNQNIILNNGNSSSNKKLSTSAKYLDQNKDG